MTSTEVESLVVRLTGDGSEYAKMLKDAQVQTQQAAAQVQAAAGRIEQVTGSLKGFATGALSALGALGAGAWLREALGNFQEAETIGLQLNATLESNGRAVEETRARYEAFALSIEAITTHEDDAVLAMLRTAETFNVTGAAAEEAVRSSIALAAATGGSAEGMIRLTAALAQGNTQQAMQFARMVPQLRGITDESEFVARAQQLIAGGMRAATAETNSSAGAMKMLKRDYGNMLEDVGKIVAEVIQPVVKGVRETIAWFRKLPDSVKQGVTFVAMLAVAVLSVAAAITLAGVIFNTAFGGVGIIIGLVVTAGIAIAAWVSKLGGVKEAWEIVQNAAGTAWDWIKAKALAFWDWLKPITDAAVSFAVTAWGLIKHAAINVWENIKRAAERVWIRIKQVWRGIFGDAEINWNNIQDVIQRAILIAEFTMLNFERVAEVAWALIKFKGMQAFDFIVDSLKTLAAVGGATANLLGQAFESAWEVMRGERKAGDFIAGIGEKWKRDFSLIFQELGGGVANEMTEQFEREWLFLSGVLEEDIEDFIARRRSEFATLNQTVENTLDSPATTEVEQMKQAIKEAEKFDAVLRGSAEGVARIIAYQDRLTATSPGGLGSGAGTLSISGNPSPSIASLSSPTPRSTSVSQDANRDRVVELLTSIDANIAAFTQRRATQITLSPSNVTE